MEPQYHETTFYIHEGEKKILLENKPIFSPPNLTRLKERMELYMELRGSHAIFSDSQVKRMVKVFPASTGADLHLLLPSSVPALEVSLIPEEAGQAIVRYKDQGRNGQKKKKKKKTKQVVVPTDNSSSPIHIAPESSYPLQDHPRALEKTVEEVVVPTEDNSSLEQIAPEPSDPLQDRPSSALEETDSGVIEPNNPAMPPNTPKQILTSVDLVQLVVHLNESVTTLTNKVDTLMQNNKVLTEKVATLTESNKVLTESNTKLTESNTELTQKVATLTQSNTEATESNKVLTQKVATLTQSNTEVTESNKVLTESNTKLTESNTELTQKVATLSESVANLQGILADSRSDEIALRSIFTVLRKKLVQELGPLTGEYKDKYDKAYKNRDGMATAFEALYGGKITAKELDLLCKPYASGNIAAHKLPAEDLARKALHKYDTPETNGNPSTAAKFFTALYKKPHQPWV